ncbi:G-type lectin S-receptor-like serine/threonine-protein kinase At2g19130 [Cryptomeria japonica]|uniref:G-type lectin S-receptor-like serine/threonine-protein kinase At2g19130 n=1 Tax=Cryptomeria japonica TaxID=3369 RepID=UPI0027D9D4C4|nr:G-type lectin S-receptor-like serine/threonine-protein kinase At2g19130 [Cryptomeria japonica]
MAIHGISAFKCVECFLLGFILIMLVHRCECSRDVLTLGESLSINQTIISENGTFALGFFSPNGSTNLYVGIWFAQIPNKSVVWVANREAPLRTISGVLKLSTDGYLSLFDSEGRSLWSTERAQKAKASSVMIMENGNLVMLGQQNKNESVWESFEHPGDTWLTEMKMWKGMRLTSWKSDVDPAPGPFSLGMDPSPGKTQFLLLYNNTKSYWTTGEWVVDRFIYVPELTISGSTLVPSEFVKYSPTSMYFRYLHPDASQRIPQRLVMYKSGDLRSFYGFANGEWNVVWSAPRDMCNVYDMCGAYGVCTSLNIQFCNCLRGFNPKDDRAWYSQEWWASGCVRRTPLNCSTDGFTQLTDKSFPDNVIPSMQTKHATVKECTAACLTNCSCTAFAITNSTPPACQMWFGDLLNVRNSANARPLFIRMAASELSEGGESKAKRTTILALCISLPVAAMAAAVFLLVARKRRRSGQQGGDDEELPASLRIFSYKELQVATKNFKAKHKLGKGAFGVVYKGTLPDKTLVAVKKLQGSGQAEKQFRAEISTIGNIQHVNLVMLRGFCSQGSRRLLVYEYMPNGSLSSFLSQKSAAEGHKVLDWKTRFQIALGCARGLFYLHEECRDRIIHCDIKPENILLNADFCPKVADFGLAKLVGRDFSRVLTTTRGTRGYLAPEWISGLPITPKADVYSYGMTLLEIISGRRNIDLEMQDSSKYYFPTWAANQIHEGNVMNLVDQRISGNADLDEDEVKRAAFVSIVCIQEDESVRPSMGEVVLMLEGKMEPHAPQLSASLQVLVHRHAGAQQTDSSI